MYSFFKPLSIKGIIFVFLILLYNPITNKTGTLQWLTLLLMIALIAMLVKLIAQIMLFMLAGLLMNYMVKNIRLFMIHIHILLMTNVPSALVTTMNRSV